MFKIILGSLFLFVTTVFVFSQDTLTIYYDIDWEETDEENAKYYRKKMAANDLWMFTDFYLNGQEQCIGSYSIEEETREGQYRFFHENGQKKSLGLYKNDNKIGTWIGYRENGSQRYETNFNDLGQRNGNSKTWHKNGQLFSEGTFKTDSVDGEWNWYHNNGQKGSQEFYKDGALTSFTFWNSDGTIVEDDFQAEQMPEFPKGQVEMLQFIYTNIKYPTLARENGVEGMVVVGFKVDTDGSIIDVEIRKSVHELLDIEAIRVVKTMPKWIPGKQHNIPVKVQYNLPVRYKLESSKMNKKKAQKVTL